MKKTAIIFCLLAIVGLLLGGCARKEAPVIEPEPVPVPDLPVEVPEPEVVEPELPEAEVPTEYAGRGAEMISDVACSDGRISARLTNTGDSAVTVGRDMVVMLRGMVVLQPECETMALEPGQSTVCTKLNGPFPVAPGRNEIAVKIRLSDAVATVTC